jgi:chromosome partitioning protein
MEVYMCKIIALVNQKGGVSKSTTILELAFHLSNISSQRVLVVDLDPQGHATMKLLSDTPKEGINELLLDKNKFKDIDKYVIPARADWPNVFVLPATPALGFIGPHLNVKRGKERLLKGLLDPLREHFAFILIDNGPTLGDLAINALVAADVFVVPTEAANLSIDGISKVVGLAKELADEKLADGLDLHSILVTRFPTLKAGSFAIRDALTELQKVYGKKLAPTLIPDSTKVLEAQSQCKPVSSLWPDNPASKAYAEFARSLL